MLQQCCIYFLKSITALKSCSLDILAPLEVSLSSSTHQEQSRANSDHLVTKWSEIAMSCEDSVDRKLLLQMKAKAMFTLSNDKSSYKGLTQQYQQGGRPVSQQGEQWVQEVLPQQTKSLPELPWHLYAACNLAKRVIYNPNNEVRQVASSILRECDVGQLLALYQNSAKLVDTLQKENDNLRKELSSIKSAASLQF